jgi:hypothetical protein
MKTKQINLINSWGSPAKKNKWSICVRVWKLTIIDLAYVIKDKEQCNSLRLIIFNLGIEL